MVTLVNKQRICFISGKLKGTDGVSLEVDKWADILRKLNYEVFYLAGKFDHDLIDTKKDILVPGLSFDSEQQKYFELRAFPFIDNNPNSYHLNMWDKRRLMKDLVAQGNDLASEIDHKLEEHNIDIIIGENTNAMPMSLLGAVAMKEIAGKYKTLFHHHDFYWERKRFRLNNIDELLSEIMPPLDPSIKHAVISRYAKTMLRENRGIEGSIIVPNCENFDNPPVKDDYNSDFRNELGFKEDDILLLEPTRVVRRKKIEVAIDFADQLGSTYNNKDKVKLLVSLDAGDEPDSIMYQKELEVYAKQKEVQLHFISDRVNSIRHLDKNGRKIYTNRDVLVNADLGLYPPDWEGFGNAYLEMTAAKLPIVVSQYIVFNTDIAPKGFKNIVLGHDDLTGDSIINNHHIEKANRLLEHPEEMVPMVERNFEIGKKFFGYETLENRLSYILDGF